MNSRALFICLVLLLFVGCVPGENLLGQATGTGPAVSRSFSASMVPRGAILTVTLSVTGVVDEPFYLIEETPPPGWTITSVNGQPPEAPGGNQLTTVADNVLKIIVIDGVTGAVEDTQYTYTVQIPPTAGGSSSFIGVYSFSAEPEDLATIAGDTTVTVQVCTDSDQDTYYAEGGVCGLADCNDQNSNIRPGAAETCNGIDDNCDLSIDENLVTTSVCAQDGVCSGATSTCVAGQWGPCSIVPSAETCNGLDDNCNGQTDENLVTTSGCTQNGVCFGATRTCAGGEWGACSILPSEETCNELDDNCDGRVDEERVCSVCGNGDLEEGEECDDGNTIGADGCSSRCRVDPVCAQAGPDDIRLDPSQPTHTVTTSGVLGAARVRVAAWSEPGGQNDLEWYEAVETSPGVWDAVIDLSRHGSGDRVVAAEVWMHGDPELVPGDEVLCDTADFRVAWCPSTAELLAAINSWQQSDTGTPELLGIIQSWLAC